MKIFKTIGIFICVLLVLAMTGIDVTYLVLKYSAGQRITSTTNYLNKITDSKGNTEDILYVKYNKNTNKNGLECFDVKINYFTDEKRENIYWQGMQYIANDKNSDIKWFTGDNVDTDYEHYLAEQAGARVSKKVATKHKGLWEGSYFGVYLSPFVNSKTTSRYNYQSLDGFESLNSSNPVSKNTYLTLQLGDQLIYMQFRYDDFDIDFKNGKFISEYERIGSRSYEYALSAGYEAIYNYYTVDYFCYQIYNAVQSLPAGTVGSYTLEFGDAFKFYYADENKCRGDEMSTKDSDLVKNKIKTYFTMNVEISADGAQSKDDSLFKVLHGDSNYSVEGGSDTTGNYFAGRQVIHVDYRHFDKVLVGDKKYALKLRQDFLDTYLPKSDVICLAITIDTDILAEKGIEYAGFTSDSGINNFKVKEINILPGTTEVA